MTSSLVHPSPNDHFTSFLANFGFVCVSHAWPIQNVDICTRPSDIIDTLTMFPSTNRLQEEYTREFTKFKPDKKLQWLPHLGTVQLDVELEDRTVSAEVPPLEAALIELFSEKGMGFFVMQGTHLEKCSCLGTR